MAVTFRFDFERTLAAMVYIAAKNPPALDTYKFCKLIFLGDKLHLVRYGRPITGDLVCAMEFGPVPSETYRLLCGLLEEATDDPRVMTLHDHFGIDHSYRYPRVNLVNPLEFEEFLSRSDMRALDEAVAAYGHKSFDELKSLTHQMPAWDVAWNDPKRSAKNPVMAFEDMFEQDSEARAGVREEMIENFTLRQVFNGSL